MGCDPWGRGIRGARQISKQHCGVCGESMPGKGERALEAQSKGLPRPHEGGWEGYLVGITYKLLSER